MLCLIIQWRRGRKSLKRHAFRHPRNVHAAHKNGGQFIFPRNRHCRIREQTPHHLVEAFKSTLEEITEADLILHIVDSSNPNYEKQIAVTNQVLKELGADKIPMIYCFNKSDLLGEDFYIPRSMTKQ